MQQQYLLRRKLPLPFEKQNFGEPLPEFTLPTPGGQKAALSDYMEGRQGAVVLFWSSTCSHCVRYDPVFSSFAKRHPDLAFVAIASRHGETVEDVRKAAVERKLTFPLLMDPGSKTAAQWHTQQTPRVFLMDKERRLLYRGAVDNFKYPEDPEYVPYLEPAISEFLAGKPITRPETASYGCAIMSVYYVLPRAL
jgi:peroxiredoxin